MNELAMANGMELFNKFRRYRKKLEKLHRNIM